LGDSDSDWVLPFILVIFIPLITIFATCTLVDETDVITNYFSGALSPETDLVERPSQDHCTLVKTAGPTSSLRFKFLDDTPRSGNYKYDLYLCNRARMVISLLPGLPNLVPILFILHRSMIVRRAAVIASILGGLRFAVPVLLAVAAPGGWNLSALDDDASDGYYAISFGFNSASVSLLLWIASVAIFGVLSLKRSLLGPRLDGTRHQIQT
jgi:hypothetical protein